MDIRHMFNGLNGRKLRLLLLVIAALLLPAGSYAECGTLLSHIRDNSPITCTRGITANKNSSGLSLRISEPTLYNWCRITNPHTDSWNLSNTRYIRAEVRNTGTSRITVLFIVVGDKGWNSVIVRTRLMPGESKTLKCDLRETFKDGTVKLDPAAVSHIEFMTFNSCKGAQFQVSDVTTEGIAPTMKPDRHRLEVPLMQEGLPEAGKRVRYTLPGQTDKYGALYLPEDWKPGKPYPLIVEFPGNIYYTIGCYSTGRPEQCAIGYGISRGKGAIWLSLPFVDYTRQDIAENKWGNPEHTVDFALRMISRVRKEFNIDARKIFLTGFSRGAIACGYIGLRNKEIASLWRGMIVCQHFDGDGWGGSVYEDASRRLQQWGKDIPQIHIDNENENLRRMFKENSIDATFLESGIGGHTSDMLLDNRPAARAVREWYKDKCR